MPRFDRLLKFPGLALVALIPCSISALTVPADCDYLVLTDSLLLPEARRLADMRASNHSDQIIKPHVATTADIYRDHPASGPRSRSILAFLRDVNHKNGNLPGHLLLFGDATKVDSSADNRVPTYTYLVRSSRSSDFNNPVYDTVSSDDAYAELLDTIPLDSIRPRTAVGRIPARTAAQARQYVDKAVAYETRFPYGPGAFTYGFASDDDLQKGANGELEPISDLPELHERLWHSMEVKPFVRRLISLEFPIQSDFTKPGARDSLISIFNSGPARFYFVGHGGGTQLADENLFRVPDDLARLRSRPLAPIAVMLTGPVADFLPDHGLSMGEELIFHPHGVIAFLGPVKEAYPMTNNKFFEAWDDTASHGGTLGRSMSRAKASSDFDAQYYLAMALLGDPALTLRVPAFDLAPASGSGSNRLVLQGAGATGDSVYYQVVQVDSVPYEPFLHPGNYSQRNRKFLREGIIGEGYAALGAGGDITLDLPAAQDPRYAAVKVMSWSSQGMRYGHFALSSLGPIGSRATHSRAKATAPYRLILNGTRIQVQWRSSGGSRQADIKGISR